VEARFAGFAAGVAAAGMAAARAGALLGVAALAIVTTSSVR